MDLNLPLKAYAGPKTRTVQIKILHLAQRHDNCSSAGEAGLGERPRTEQLDSGMSLSLRYRSSIEMEGANGSWIVVCALVWLRDVVGKSRRGRGGGGDWGTFGCGKAGRSIGLLIRRANDREGERSGVGQM